MSVLPEKERPAPPKVVVWSLPFRSAERRVFAAAEIDPGVVQVAVWVNDPPPGMVNVPGVIHCVPRFWSSPTIGLIRGE